MLIILYFNINHHIALYMYLHFTRYYIAYIVIIYAVCDLHTFNYHNYLYEMIGFKQDSRYSTLRCIIADSSYIQSPLQNTSNKTIIAFLTLIFYSILCFTVGRHQEFIGTRIFFQLIFVR